MGTPEALGLAGRRCVHLIGAGGKSTLLRALADALVGAGRTVIATTTTRIREAEAAGALVLADSTPAPAEAVAATIARHGRVTVAIARLADEGKLAGLQPGTIDALVAARVADVMLVEADGAAGRPLKAHAPHEPVIAGSADLVIAVIGAGVLGRPATDEHVHRAALLRERLGISAAHPIGPADVAAILFHPEGWLARVPAGVEVVAFVNAAGDPAARAGAEASAEALRQADRRGRLARVVAGDARPSPAAPAAQRPRL